MHLMMILAALTVAWSLRCSLHHVQGSWDARWRRSLFLFVFPPLLILMTGMAVLCMGPEGKMGGIDTGWLSYEVALIFLGFLAILCITLALQGWQSVESARKSPLVNVGDKQVRLLSTDALFAGQIGFWHPELVVSQGLLATLSPAHLESVLAHEQGHYHYRDTFWFFWLGWIRACSIWLPNTDFLWEELLALRELRADSYAASRVDPLLLAESLLLVVSSNNVSSEVCCAALGTIGGKLRLEQRIEALLAPPEPTPEINWQFWNIFLLAFLPLVSVVFHK
ncbi:M56 family metallopeptidase [Umezakia ovalisporum]|jgi:Zn-dependent protease with chaperone function|uniref:M56 family metallopeptidase n=2 Tax=Umezakia ovalisporum TaxID=75695 RepID=A0AA43H0Z3_9CYAN|nr:M56 family metallopeptidase [Umezakia ovalisporum]MDH6057475.1 M56 family metallopeptidase [Umezakia ovalisporum FSS-43]MDH6064685.1 M56 family metallopeptidase [Umezakia ovalisporum FSS-62]MDH6069044.1 M56 family metallopeptidase [Umezakia ovalisporum APH033B]MDH6069410.1 M56 family metallopeptidase [Umezakia ovalisporum CobakiLakeA]MDH6073468.1 M56 family metallopeptidase [Umezakia ovalisporum CS-1034]